MKLIDEIIELLSSSDRNLTDALVKTKIVLHKIGHKELIDWVNNELNGYPSEDQIPPYRVLPARVLANMTNISFQANAHPVPIMHLEDSYREILETAKMTESLSVLEKFSESDGGSLQRPIPMEANTLLGKSLTKGTYIQSAWSEIQLTGITSILTQVRSRLLDFLLELNEKFPSELSDQEIKERAATTDAENLFNNAIFGDNTTVIVGSGNTQRINATVIKGDFNSLSNTLREHGVEESEINALKEAIASDAVEGAPKAGVFGSSVKVWLQGMLSKAVDTSWQIELGVASSLLASALQRFYGWL